MKKDKSLNDEQNLAVYSRGSSILVSAPAGSGKTKILVNRMMSLIEDDHYHVDSLLVLTFTKAAALEMKQRLIESLNQRIQVVDDSLKQHLEKQKILLNDAYITNFHSFCSDLLSQYGYAIHLDSQFEILENPTLIKEKILNQCLDQWVKQPSFKQFYQSNFAGYRFDKFKEIIFKLDSLSHNIYHFENYLQNIKESLYDQVIEHQTLKDTPIEKPLIEIINQAYQEGYQYFLQLEDFCQTYGLGFYQEATKTLPSVHDVLQQYYDSLKNSLDQEDYFHLNMKVEKHRNASFKDVDDHIKETYKTLLDKAKNTFISTYEKCMPASIEELSEILKLTSNNLDHYLDYLKQFQKAYQSYKQSLSYLDFNDLEQYTLQLLSEDNGVAQTLYQQFNEIMIDEYQDTNEIQENLILLISRYQNPEINRFMVGDMKQSIYRFRKADLDIFNEKYLTYGKKDSNQRIDLKFNYRSNKIVLDSINYIFNAIMDRRFGGLEYDHDPNAKLNYDFLRKEKCDTEVKLAHALTKLDHENRFDTDIILVLKPNEKVDMIDYEAKMIAKKIDDMVGHLDLDFFGQKRKSQYKDIVVLMRNVANFITYKKVFDACHIPNLIVLTKGFFESNEIIDCVYLLKALDNPLDDIAFTSILKGNYAFSHFDEDFLYVHKQDHKSMYESLLESHDESIIQFLNYFHDLLDYSKQKPVYQILQKFLKDSDYSIFVSSLYNGKQRAANIDLFVEMLKADCDLSLYQIVKKIDQTITLNIDYKPATLSSDGNVVTFMTIHQSKGLEFPIVIVNQLNHQFNFDDSKNDLIQDKNLGIILKPFKTQNLHDYKNVLTEYRHPLKGLFQATLDNETINEEMRILYVALTRASQKLILTGGLKDIKMIENWQNQIIDYALDASVHLLPAILRKSNQMLNWVMLAIIRHPDFIQQCLDLSLFDDKIKNAYSLDEIKQNAAKINLYQEKEIALNTRHAKFHTSIIDYHTIDEYSFSKNEQTSHHSIIYENNRELFYQNHHPIDKTIAVTQIVDDGNRIYPERNEEDTTMKATDRGTIIHRVLELLPTHTHDLNQELAKIYQLEEFDQQSQELTENYKQHIQDFIESPIYQLMNESNHIYKEKPFSMKEDNDQIIHGIFDVICVKQNNIYIIDYKTDRVSKHSDDHTLKCLHEGQMNYYKKILARVFPQANIQAIVYYLAINRYVIL